MFVYYLLQIQHENKRLNALVKLIALHPRLSKWICFMSVL